MKHKPECNENWCYCLDDRGDPMCTCGEPAWACKQGCMARIQSEMGVPADGIWGPASRNAFHRIVATARRDPVVMLLANGTSNPASNINRQFEVAPVWSRTDPANVLDTATDQRDHGDVDDPPVRIITLDDD